MSQVKRDQRDTYSVKGGLIHKLKSVCLTSTHMTHTSAWIIAHILCLYAGLCLLMNSQWSDPLFNVTVNPKFSGEIRWERIAWGPRPWNITFKNVRLIDAGRVEVITAEQMIVKDYDLEGLLNKTYGAHYVGIIDGQVSLTQRPHTYDSSRLIWNITELFKSSDDLVKLKNGDPKPPVLVHVDDIDLIRVSAKISTSTVLVKVKDVVARQGFFEIDLPLDVMRIRVGDLKIDKAETRVFIRDRHLDMTQIERARAPLKRTLIYQNHHVNGRALWWLKDAFGGRDLDTQMNLHDRVSLRRWVLDLAPLGVPHGRAYVEGDIVELEKYISPWGLDQWVRGDLKIKGDIHGPLDDPATHEANIEGQLFVPVIGSARFQFDGHKNRDGKIAITQGRLWSRLGDLGVKARLDLKHNLGSAHLTAHELIWSSLSKLPPSWRAWEKSAVGEISLKLRPDLSEGSLFNTQKMKWELGLDVDLRALGPKRVSLSGRAVMTPQEIKLHQSALTLHRPRDLLDAKPRQRVSAQGTIDLIKREISGGLRLTGAIRASSLPPLKLPLSAHLNLAMKVEGPLSAPRLNGQLNAKKIKSDFGGYKWRIQNLVSHFSLRDRIIKLWKSTLKTQEGRAQFELNLPIDKPQNLSGWARLKRLFVDLSPLNIPFSGVVEGLACTLGAKGCERFKTLVPNPAGQAQDSCIKALYTQDLGQGRGGEACLSIRAFRALGVKFRELELDASIRPDWVKVRRGRLWGDALFADLQGQIDHPWGATPQLNTSLRLKLRLDILQRFFPSPPAYLQFLSGHAAGDLEFHGPLSHLEGSGALTLRRVSTILETPRTHIQNPHKISLGESSFSFELYPERVSIQGHLGRQLWVDGEYLFRPAELSIGVDFPHLYLTMFSARSSGSPRELRALLQSLERPFGQVSDHGLDESPPLEDPTLRPIVINQSPQQTTLITLNNRYACDWIHQPLSLSQTLRLGIQGRAQLTWQLSRDVPPQLGVELDHMNAAYWTRGLNGRVLHIDDEMSRCTDLCERHRAAVSCPTIEFSAIRKNRIEIGGDHSFGERILLNPTRGLSAAPHVSPRQTQTQAQSLPPTEMRSQQATQVLKPCVLDKIEHEIAGDIELNFMELRGAYHTLALRLGLMNGEVFGCLRGEVKLKLLSPFLKGLVQQVSGQLKVESRIFGPADALTLSGQAHLETLDLLSPRVRALGDITLVKPITLNLDEISSGGVEISLPSKKMMELKRNEGKIIIDDLSLNLPQFKLKKLGVGFSAPYFDLMMPPLLRTSLKLSKMRFELVNQTDDLRTSRSRISSSALKSKPRRRSTSRSSNTSSASKSDEKSGDDTSSADPTVSGRSMSEPAPPSLSLSGDVNIIRGVYSANFLSLEEMVYQGGINAMSGRKAVDTLSVFETLPLLQDFRLDVRLKGDDEIIFKSQIADIATLDLELLVNVQLKGKLFLRPEDPLEERIQIGGEVETLDGSTLTISQNPFDITHAKVLFGGDLGQDSQTSELISAELVAHHTFRIPPTVNRGRQINFDQKLNADLIDEEVTLTGQLKMASPESPFKINFDLTSQSGRERIEILYLVLFGSYPAGPNMASGTQPTGILISPMLNFIERPLADSFGLDNLSLTPDSGRLAIDVNKVFSRRLRLNLRTQFGEIDPNNPQSVFLEYKLNNLFSGEVTAERRGELDPGSGRLRLRLRLSWD